MVLLDEILRYSGGFLLIINTILFIKSHNSNQKIMALTIFNVYLVFSSLINTTLIIQGIFEIHNLYLSHFYFILQYILLSYFYYQFFNKSQRLLIKSVSLAIFIILTIQYMLDSSLFYKFNLLEVLLTSFPLVAYSLIHLDNSLTGRGEFLYINAAILIYLSSSTLIFILGNFLATFEKEFIRNIWTIHKALYIVYLIFIFLEWKNNLAPLKDKT